MTRRTLELAYINNDSTRRSTYNKRKKGIMKKAEELTTLCGVEGCVVIYPAGPDSQPEVWPSDEQARRLLSDYRASPNVAQKNQMVNPRSFLKQSLGKSFQALQKHCEENREKALTRVMCHNLSGKIGLQNLRKTDLKDLWWVINQNIKECTSIVDAEANSD